MITTLRALFIFLLLAAGSLMSCHSEVFLEPELPEYSIVQGDTIWVRNDRDKLTNLYNNPTVFGKGRAIVGDTILHSVTVTLPKPSKQTNLSSLRSKENDGNPFRILSIGGALSSGMRDYGWFNEGMVTSYPNILANQMGVEFKLPLFDAENYNGIDRKVATSFNPTGGPALKLKNVVNNIDINPDFIKNQNGIVTRGNAFKGETDSYSRPFESPFFERVNRKKEETEIRNGKGFDFFILELQSLENSINSVSQFTHRSVEQLNERDFKAYPEDGFLINYSPYSSNLSGTHYHDNLVRLMKNRKVEKGVIVNVVSASLREAKHKNYSEDLTNFMQKYQLGAIYAGYYTNGTTPMGYSYWDIKEKGYYVSGQTSTMDSILAPNVNIHNKPALTLERAGYALDIVDKKVSVGKDENIESSNKSLAIYSKYLNVPIFDLNNLYKSIHGGKYITNDGILVDPTFGTGNFFSIDGITPSAFGQAVIANEIITTINSFYKTDIPLTPTNHYLKK